ncbi:zinc-binding dehydrogenase [Pseudocitrobacter cyperus]|uniref:Zinc-binding dehydrogenase n=1 Tax=Pseudocitrobacter cyperus TaxID=3112843 RepID=A0ABV0HFZ3_9ENTR
MNNASFSLPTHYQGWVYTGGELPQGLKLQDIPLPQLKADEVLVQNEAIGLNPVDWKVMTPGSVPGVDAAGIVVQVGDASQQSWLGKRVAYHQNLQAQGSFARFTPMKSRALMVMPDELSFEQAASFPCPGLTAWQAIEKVPTQVGSELLISGAGGAVGQYLVQLAKARGYCITTLSHERHHARLQSLGAEVTRVNDEEVANKRFYAVIDSTNPEHAEKLADLLEANGHLVAIQGRVEQWPCAPFGRALSLHEVALGALHQHGSDAQWKHLMQQGEQLLRKVADGSLQAEERHLFSFDEMDVQLLALKHRNFSGKQVILTA